MRLRPGKQYVHHPEGLPEGAAVRIGDEASDRAGPEVRLDKFGGEAFLVIRHPHAREHGPPEQVVAGKLEIVRGGGRGRVTHRFYEVPDPSERGRP